MTSQLDRALELSAFGYFVFPCKPDKAPYTVHGVKDASRNHNDIERWWTQWPDAQVGVATGKSNIIVADIDMKKGKNGFNALAALQLTLPTTWSYDTPSGGKHFVYNSSKRLPQSTNLGGTAEGVDRQSGESYVIWYGDCPWEVEVAEPPAWLTAYYGGGSDYPDAPPFEGELADWVNALPTGQPSYFVQGFLGDIGGHVGNGELVKLTYRLAFLAAQGEPGTREAHDQLRASYWATSNESEKGKEREWDRLLRGAIAQAEEAERQGNVTPYAGGEWEPKLTPEELHAMDFGGPALTAMFKEGQPEVVLEPRIKVLTYSDLLNIPAPSWWVPGLFKESSLAIVAGSGGLGKTFMMLHVSACVATGTPFFGREVKKGRVLYVGAEGVEDFAKRLQAAADKHGFDLAEIQESMHFVESGVVLTDNSSMDEFAKVLAAGNYDFIVLDTFSQLAAVQNENDAAQVAQVFRVARRLRSLTPGSTVVTVHHAGKETGKYRGSSAMRDNVDTLVSVQGKSNGFSLSTLADDAGKQRSAQPEKIEGFELVGHLDSAVIELTGAKAERAAKDDPDWHVISQLMSDGETRSLAEIARLTDLSERKVQRATETVRKNGAWLSLPDGKKVGWRSALVIGPSGYED